MLKVIDNQSLSRGKLVLDSQDIEAYLELFDADLDGDGTPTALLVCEDDANDANDGEIAWIAASWNTNLSNSANWSWYLLNSNDANDVEAYSIEGDTVLIFPDELADMDGNLMTWMVVGQHGAATRNSRDGTMADLDDAIETMNAYFACYGEWNYRPVQSKSERQDGYVILLGE